ncbi:MAG: radical SAM protein [Candidatus ainarchaeum sp.]|nr:radical SAM protein [Candidatus ainarchaeum sp.]MDD3976103.1 radical SAM protein [Candidatus ainarchaeum sp.]
MSNYFRTPLFPSIDLSTKCNLSCIHCRNNKNKISKIPFKKVIELLDEFESLEVFHLAFAGGEPFLFPKIYDVLEYSQKLNVPKVTIVTNCTFINKDRIDKLDNNKIRFAVSLDGPKEIHNFIRNADVFDKVIDNIKYLVSKGFFVMLNCTLMKYNYKYFDEIIKIAKNLKVNQINFSKVFPVHSEIIKFMLSKEELDELYENYRKYSGEDSLVIFLDKGYMGFPDAYDSDIAFSMGCRAGISQINVMSDGSVVGCKLLPDVCAGNIYKNTIKEIWDDNNNWKLFRNVIQNINSDTCKKCDYFYACKGGCRAFAYYMTGDINGKDPLCPL